MLAEILSETDASAPLGLNRNRLMHAPTAQRATQGSVATNSGAMLVAASHFQLKAMPATTAAAAASKSTPLRTAACFRLGTFRNGELECSCVWILTMGFLSRLPRKASVLASHMAS
ncbi:hypothetical protein C7I85_28955 [Mesorhizobium soli]|uniref:Uncharacterized protein n=1 Tax=Pseudaminobacter soli (ex Li et al. 2025) TaxID=1295366 RepID=A0A2P7RPT2_9HYPH|nr:hypothetical protein C7I85_28955 [Mesorhizobium soli]